jgi:hypothetical protein
VLRLRAAANKDVSLLEELSEIGGKMLDDGVTPERRVARIPLSGLSDSIFVQPLSASANSDKERG